MPGQFWDWYARFVPRVAGDTTKTQDIYVTSLLWKEDQLPVMNASPKTAYLDVQVPSAFIAPQNLEKAR